MSSDESRDEKAQYMSRLDRALESVPYDTARDIRAGIEEELNELEGTGLKARLAMLDDPVAIAEAARGELGADKTSRRSSLTVRLFAMLGIALGALAAVAIIVTWLFAPGSN